MSYNLCRDDTVTKRFWKKVEKTPTCWNWIGGTFNDGYGNIGNSRGAQKAHRIAYELHVGPIPEGLVVMHSCDNRRCVNPAHLSVGTHATNIKDRDLRGRGSKPKGSLNAMAKLTEREALLIRTMPLPVSSLAEIFSVHAATIRRVLARKIWSHV